MFDDEDNARVEPMSRALEVMRSVWAVEHAARHLSRTMEASLGVTGPQRLVIRVVGRFPGVSAGELASRLALDASTLTGHLQHLEELGMLARRSSADDGRRVEVYLTARGRRLDVRTPGTVEAAVEDAINGTKPQEIELVEKFLARLVTALGAQSALYEKKPKRRRK